MDPVPQVRLCQDDPPVRRVPPTASIRIWSPRSSASSAAVEYAMPAASSTAAPSSQARRRSSAAPAAFPFSAPAGPQTASTAFARLVSSLPYFQRMTSCLTGARNVLPARPAATWRAVSSAPAG